MDVPCVERLLEDPSGKALIEVFHEGRDGWHVASSLLSRRDQETYLQHYDFLRYVRKYGLFKYLPISKEELTLQEAWDQHDCAFWLLEYLMRVFAEPDLPREQAQTQVTQFIEALVSSVRMGRELAEKLRALVPWAFSDDSAPASHFIVPEVMLSTSVVRMLEELFKEGGDPAEGRKFVPLVEQEIYKRAPTPFWQDAANARAVRSIIPVPPPFPLWWENKTETWR